MRALVLGTGRELGLVDVPVPDPGPGQVRVAVSACGLCRTDLHVLDGDLAHPKLPLVLGHQVVGRVVALGAGLDEPRLGDRVGIPWLGYTCDTCMYCRSGHENLCPTAGFTGYTIDGCLAEYAVADARYCLPLPDGYPDLEVAPLLCAGLIGSRALRMAGAGECLGLYGFGAAAHLVLQLARHRGQRVFAFVRAGDSAAAQFALGLGAEWAGDSMQPGPLELDAAIIFAPAGELVPAALRAVRPGGTVVCAGIHMTDIPSFPYEVLWHERQLRSVANLTRQDGLDFLAEAPQVPLRTHAELYRLEEAPKALERLRAGDVRGAAVVDLRGGVHRSPPAG